MTLKKLDKAHLELIRYSEEVNSYKISFYCENDEFLKIRNSFLINHLPVNRKLTPNIYKTCGECLSVLGLDNLDHNISIFIYQSHEMNAQCLTGFEGNIIILISSALIKLLSNDELRFVIGHELGHYLFHKKFQMNNSLEGFILSRSQEITADRVGLICSQSLDSCVRAIMKVSSGLDENHLVFDVNSVLEEFKNIDVLNIPFEEMYASHPPLAIRSRAFNLVFCK